MVQPAHLSKYNGKPISNLRIDENAMVVEPGSHDEYFDCSDQPIATTTRGRNQ
jgi:hypothetical protein